MTIQPRYTIDADSRTGLVRIAIIGFWEIADVGRFAQDHGREILRVVRAGRIPRTLIDYSQSAIQSQQVVGAFQALARNPAARSIGVALYTTGGVARLQARRICDVRDDMRSFANLDEALAWLNGLQMSTARAA